MAQGPMEDDWQFVWSNTMQGQVWFHAATGDRRWPDGVWERRWSNTFQRFIWFDGLQRMDQCPLASAAQPAAQQPSTPVEAYAAAAAAALAEQKAREEANLRAAEAAAEEARKEQARRALQRQREEQERKASLVSSMHENMQKRAQEAARKAEAEAAERRSREEAARQARRAAEDLARIQAQQAADKRYQEAAERRAAERKAAEQKAEEDRRREEMQSQVPPRRGRTSPQASGGEAAAAAAAPRRESSGRSVSAAAGAKRRAESPSSDDSDSSSSCVRKAAPRPPRRLKAVEGWPTTEEFQGLPREDRERTFWRFVHEAVLGPKSAEPLCRDHVLGGASCLLPDAQCVAREIFAQERFSLREKIWRCFIATWLGCGGPAFRSLRYLCSGARLFGDLCPPAAQLPPADAALKNCNLEPMYENLREIVRLPGHKPKDVLSGDGRFTMGRFGDKQGLPLLCAWRDAFCNLADPHGTDEELRRALEAMSPAGIDGYLRPLLGWSDLAIKELFTYMEVILPRAFDSDVFVPFGGGATAGGRLVLGDVARGELHVHTRDLIQRLPPETAAAISQAFRDRIEHLPANVRGLPGYMSRLEGGRLHPLNVLDVEVCFCWFQAFLKNKVGKWKAFRRDLWEGSS